LKGKRARGKGYAENTAIKTADDGNDVLSLEFVQEVDICSG
jgi:hypothetical protein